MQTSDVVGLWSQEKHLMNPIIFGRKKKPNELNRRVITSNQTQTVTNYNCGK